jgi:DNA repair protein RecN (Recombination protein N)
VAEVVGRKLAALSLRHQVLCITHLPQIAKFADHHFNISKEVASGRTRTVITPLSDAERTRELARMLGGETITRITLEHARELLGRKHKAKG